MKKRVITFLMTVVLTLSISGVVSANDSSMAPKVGESFGYIPDYVDNFWFDYWWPSGYTDDYSCDGYIFHFYNVVVGEDGNLIFYYPYFPFEIGRPPVFSRDYDDYDDYDYDYDYDYDDDDDYFASGSVGEWNEDIKPEVSIIPAPSKDYSAGGSSLPNIATIQ